MPPVSSGGSYYSSWPEGTTHIPGGSSSGPSSGSDGDCPNSDCCVPQCSEPDARSHSSPQHTGRGGSAWLAGPAAQPQHPSSSYSRFGGDAGGNCCGGPYSEPHQSEAELVLHRGNAGTCSPHLLSRAGGEAEVDQPGCSRPFCVPLRQLLPCMLVITLAAAPVAVEAACSGDGALNIAVWPASRPSYMNWAKDGGTSYWWSDAAGPVGPPAYTGTVKGIGPEIGIGTTNAKLAWAGMAQQFFRAKIDGYLQVRRTAPASATQPPLPVQLACTCRVHPNRVPGIKCACYFTYIRACGNTARQHLCASWQVE